MNVENSTLAEIVYYHNNLLTSILIFGVIICLAL